MTARGILASTAIVIISAITTSYAETQDQPREDSAPKSGEVTRAFMFNLFGKDKGVGLQEFAGSGIEEGIQEPALSRQTPDTSADKRGRFK